MWCCPRVVVRLVPCHLELAVFADVFGVVVVGGFRERGRIVWRAILQVRGRKMRGGVGKGP